MDEYRGTKEHPFHTSAGGVVIRQDSNQTEVLLLHRFKSANWPVDSWHLPKGTRHKGETLKETAKREIGEETGWQVRIGSKIGTLRSTFERDGVIIQKTSHYYQSFPVKQMNGTATEHDEMKWVEIYKAKELLTDATAWEKEEEIIQKLIDQLSETK